MNRMLVLIALLAPAIAHAEWVRLTSASGGEVTVYVDPATIKRNGGVVEFAALYDYASVRTLSGAPFQSATIRNEIDCKQKKSRTLDVSSHSEPMAGGHVVSTSTGYEPWARIAPKTILSAAFDFVCKKKPPAERKAMPSDGRPPNSLIDA